MNSSIKIAVIQFPGSNTERETILAIKRAKMQPIEFLWNQDYSKLSKCDGFILVGGFSYEDRARAGIIASLDPIINVIKEQAEKQKPVLGICNGAQILVESGMIPGFQDYQLGMALTNNKRVKLNHVIGTGYYNNWAYLISSARKCRSAFNYHFQKNQVINIPFAHAEGRFVISNDLLNQLIDYQQIVFNYCDENGKIVPDFPINPNGSTNNIAGICNPMGNVMALMPHPERSLNGDKIFTSIREYINQPKHYNYKPLTPINQKKSIIPYKSPSNSLIWYIDTIITNNDAVSVQNAIKRLGINIKVEKLYFWQIELNSGDKNQIANNIIQSGELFNSNKERIVDLECEADTTNLLIIPKEDFVGLRKLEILKNHFNINKLKSITQGVIWKLTTKNFQSIQKALDLNVFYNPYSHNCYEIGK